MLVESKFFNCDCMEFLKTHPEEFFDCIISDPPYNLNYKSNHRKENSETKFDYIQNDNMTKGEFYTFMDICLEELKRVLKNNSHIYIFCSWHNIDTFKLVFEKHFKLKNILIWDKGNMGMGDLKGSYGTDYEFILFGQKGRRELNGKRDRTIIHIPRVSGNKQLHPTEKPIDLYKFLVEKSTNEDECVLDPFAGSCPLAVACEQTNRKFVCMDINEDYIKKGEERYNESIKS